MSVITDLISLAARLIGLKPGPKVERIVDKHWFPRPNTAQHWVVGPDTCFWCLAYDREHREVTDPPCPRRRPNPIEVA